jgi:hypothetical protein
MYIKGTLVRRLLSFALLLVFGLPVVAPALGSTADAQTGLPACCRRNGAHHCTKTPEQLAAMLHGDHFAAVQSKCPCCPSAPINLHQQTMALHTPGIQAIGFVSLTAKCRQAAASARVALAGARHKRGPPNVRLS